MNILLNGISGFMGREVAKLCENGYRGASLVCGVDPNGERNSNIEIFPSLDRVISVDGVDCIIDFSHHSVTPALLDFAVANELPLVLCTTGHTDEEISLIQDAARNIPLFYSGNMSVGIALLIELAKTTAAALPEAEIEIIEKHHDRKIDAPSGTALMLANAICEVRPEAYANCGRSGQGKRTPDEIGIHSIRMGNIVGEHEVIIGTPSQTISLKHEAHNRALFAEGAIAAADFLIGQLPGMYDMKSMLSTAKAEDTVIAAK
ncbi:MAG: 4-hydroxy-tetrahydrodipicolinate reductase [Clostridia bacterium]|nr:4-hydroxy-tetrahydrodipicolinate reductase [Clostridia bacterium]